MIFQPTKTGIYGENKAMQYQTITLEIQAGIATVTLNRPEAANALDLLMTQEMMQVSIDLDHDPDVRCVILRAAGDRFFCAGGDLQAFKEAGDRGPQLVKAMTTNLHAAVSRLARGNAPVIAEVAGVAAGGGFSMVCGCDLVIASEKASFTMAYTRAGLSPDGSSSFFLSRMVGLRRAMDLALTNRVLTAAEAEEWGLINRVVPAEQLSETVNTMAAEIAQGATAAYGRAKRLILEGTWNSLETQMENESRAIADSLGSPDGKEGLDAFLNKRRPNFQGI